MNSISSSVILLIGSFFLASCEEGLFQNMRPDHTGIDFSNRIIESDTYNILNFEYMYNGGGVGIADFNNDGLLDIFFTGNMVKNSMYLNKGDFQFQNVSKIAGIEGSDRWSSGVAIVDINNDGWLDIYVCATTYNPGNRRANQLYVNQGVSKNNIPVFKDLAKDYGIADTTHTTTAAFFDYDNDGDLDLYLAVDQMDPRHSPNSYKIKKDDGSSINTDKLFQNTFDENIGHSVFYDVSKEAGILKGGFSLGLNIVDINNDGWKDIYVTNDYLSNDIFYVNNGNGTFTDRASEYLKHTSHSAMGVDIADMNNDGLPDILVLDMLPEYNSRRKTMLPPNNYTSYINNEEYGYQYQYARNTLQLNQGNRPDNGKLIFSEVSMHAGIYATDWSWAPVIAE